MIEWTNVIDWKREKEMDGLRIDFGDRIGSVLEESEVKGMNNQGCFVHCILPWGMVMWWCNLQRWSQFGEDKILRHTFRNRILDKIDVWHQVTFMWGCQVSICLCKPLVFYHLLIAWISKATTFLPNAFVDAAATLCNLFF